jgi:hypothetical protein
MTTRNPKKLPVITRQHERSPYLDLERRPALAFSHAEIEQAVGDVAASGETRRQFLSNPALYLHERRLIDDTAVGSLRDAECLFPAAGAGGGMRADPIVAVDVVAVVNVVTYLDMLTEVALWCTTYFWGCEASELQTSVGGYEAVL